MFLCLQRKFKPKSVASKHAKKNKENSKALSVVRIFKFIGILFLIVNLVWPKTYLLLSVFIIIHLTPRCQGIRKIACPHFNDGISNPRIPIVFLNTETHPESTYLPALKVHDTLIRKFYFPKGRLISSGHATNCTSCKWSSCGMLCINKSVCEGERTRILQLFRRDQTKVIQLKRTCNIFNWVLFFISHYRHTYFNLTIGKKSIHLIKNKCIKYILVRSKSRYT